MDISVELTLTPLQDSFEEPIIQFIRKLRESGLRIVENPLSTQVYGDYDQVMGVVGNEIKNAFNGMEHGLVYMKVVKSDRSDYSPDF